MDDSLDETQIVPNLKIAIGGKSVWYNLCLDKDMKIEPCQTN